MGNDSTEPQYIAHTPTHTHTMSQSPPQDRPSGGPNAISAGVYYGVTAMVVLTIAVIVIGAKVIHRRKARRAIAQRGQAERADHSRRGEAAGLPLYNDPGRTVPMPVLAYPDAAYRGEGMQDPALPQYDMANAPPKYEYNSNSNSSATAAGQQTPAPGAAPSTAPARPVEMQQTRSNSFFARTNGVVPAPPPFSSRRNSREDVGRQEQSSTQTQPQAPSQADVEGAPMHVVSLEDESDDSQRATLNTSRPTGQ